VHQNAGVNTEFFVVEPAKLVQSKMIAGLREIVYSNLSIHPSLMEI